jgi:hypothetical protein
MLASTADGLTRNWFMNEARAGLDQTRASGWIAARRAAAILSIVVASVAPAGAQLPGAPVLQNAWATPGVVGAVNFGGGADGQVFAAAASWSPSAGRFALSGGFGSRHVTGASSRGVYGVRLAIPFGGGPTSSVGFAAFVGAGGGSGGNASADSAASRSEVPVGAAIGWRLAVGATHGVSIYASPSYVFFSGGTKSGGVVRTAVAMDVGISPSVGMTAGIEFGQTRARVFGGPSGTLYAVGLAYALGHR